MIITILATPRAQCGTQSIINTLNGRFNPPFIYVFIPLNLIRSFVILVSRSVPDRALFITMRAPRKQAINRSTIISVSQLFASLMTYIGYNEALYYPRHITSFTEPR